MTETHAERLHYIIEKLAQQESTSVKKICSKLGITSSTMASQRQSKGGYIKSNVIESIMSLYPEYNIKWLIMGEGEPKKIINNGNQAINVTSDNSTSTITNQVGNKIDNNDYSQALQLKDMEIQALKQQLASQQREIEVLKNQLKDKDMIIDLLKKS